MKKYWVTISYTAMVEAKDEEDAMYKFDDTVSLYNCDFEYDVEEA